MSDKPSPRRTFIPAAALAKAVDFDDDMMRVTFIDGACSPCRWPGSAGCWRRPRSKEIVMRSLEEASACTGPNWTRTCPSPD